MASFKMRKENCELPWSTTKSYAVKVVRVSEATPSRKLDSPQSALTYWRRVIARVSWFDAEKEHLVVLILSTRYNVQGHSLVSIGCMNESIAHPREIFRAAVAGGAYKIIVMHNHPSGDPTPSLDDYRLTRRLEKCGELLQIPLLDFIIVGKGKRCWSSKTDVLPPRLRKIARLESKKDVLF
ncbi:MAG TPA: JAB domain-containing protein [Chthoniobacterales bacterium]